MIDVGGASLRIDGVDNQQRFVMLIGQRDGRQLEATKWDYWWRLQNTNLTT